MRLDVDPLHHLRNEVRSSANSLMYAKTNVNNCPKSLYGVEYSIPGQHKMPV